MKTETLREVFRNQSAHAKAIGSVGRSPEALRAEYLETRQRADKAIDDLNSGRPVLRPFPAHWWLSAAIGAIIGIALTLAVQSLR